MVEITPKKNKVFMLTHSEASRLKNEIEQAFVELDGEEIDQYYSLERIGKVYPLLADLFKALGG